MSASPLVMTTSNDHTFTPRAEFNASPSRHTPFALLSLSKTSSIRALGFSSEVYMQLNAVLKKEWPEGVEYATLKEGDGWTAVMHGTPWKKQGDEELESIRLLLGIFTTLAAAGWAVVDNIQVGASKKDAHSFLFSWKEATEIQSPKFFALSFPMPDRISIIDCPPASTPAIISSVRSSILTSSDAPLPQPQYSLSHSSTNPASPTAKSPSITWGARNVHGGTTGGVKIRDEGWVPQAEGVYSFAIGGYGSWYKPGSGVDATKYDNSHPTLLLSLLHKIDKAHFGLTASVPLLPFKKRRDILIFHSLPTANVGTASIPPSVPPSPRVGHQSLIPPRKHTLSEGRSTPPILGTTTSHSRQTSASASFAGNGHRVPPPAPAMQRLPDSRKSSVDKGRASLDQTGRESPLPLATPVADAFMRGSPAKANAGLEPIISGIEQDVREPETVEVLGRRELERRDTTGSWVIEDHPNVIPGPAPEKAPAGTVPLKEEAVAEEKGKGKEKEKSGKVLGIFGRRKKDKSVDEPQGERGRRMSRDPPKRSDTAYTEPGLAGIGAYLKLPLGKDNPHELAKLPEGSVEAEQSKASSELEPSVQPAKVREGSEERGRFHEQFRDTLEIPIEWVGDAKLAKVRQDTMPQSVQEEESDVEGSRSRRN